jgi:hypothetical protein
MATESISEKFERCPQPGSEEQVWSVSQGNAVSDLTNFFHSPLTFPNGANVTASRECRTPMSK